MGDLLHMSFACQRQMWEHHRYLIDDINAAKLYNPSEDAYHRVVVGWIYCIQLPSNINLLSINAREWSRRFGNQILALIFQVINNIVNCSLDILLGTKIPYLRSVFKYYILQISAKILARISNRFFLEAKILSNFISYHGLSSINYNKAAVNIG